MTNMPNCCQVYERPGDLPAADARYRLKCCQTFTSERNIKAATREKRRESWGKNDCWHERQKCIKKEHYSCALIRLTWQHMTHLFWWTYMLVKSVQIRTTFINQFKLGINKWKSSKRVSLMGFMQQLTKMS